MGSGVTQYGKIKLGVKSLDDATLNLGALNKGDKNLSNKALIMKALAEQDLPTLRAVSNYFYRTSGIYQRVCNYFASMYRYDWYIVPEVYDESVKEDKIVKEFQKILNYLDILILRNSVMILLLELLRMALITAILCLVLLDWFYKNCRLLIAVLTIMLVICQQQNLICVFLMNNSRMLITVCEF